MSHKEKQEIFNSFIKAQDLPLKVDDFEHLLIIFRYSGIDVKTFKDLIFSACDLVQAEQQKRIAGNITMKYHDGSTKKNSFIEYYQIGADNLTVDKSSIINPENKIS